MKLTGLNAIVTGSNQGLGLEIATAFVREGAGVAICARDESKLAPVAEALRAIAAPGAKVHAQRCDVSNPAEVSHFVEEAIRALGSIQILVNNAGVYGPKGPSETVEFEEWKR